MRRNDTNPDFKQWIAKLDQDQKKFNFNKVFKVLRQVDKEDNFRLCVKQLAIDWKVPVTRLSDEQLRTYRRDCTQKYDAESSTSGTAKEKEDREVLDDDSVKQDTSQDPNSGNNYIPIETAQDTRVQDNYKTLLNKQVEESSLENKKDSNDLIKLINNSVNSSPNNILESKNFQDTLLKKCSVKQSDLLNGIDSCSSSSYKPDFGISSNNNSRNAYVETGDKKFTPQNYPPHNYNLDSDVTTENLVKGNTPDISNKVTSEKYLSHNDNLNTGSDSTKENLEILVDGKTPKISNKVMSEKYPSHNDNLNSNATRENLENLVGGKTPYNRNKSTSKKYPSHNDNLKSDATTENLENLVGGKTPNIRNKSTSKKYPSHNDNLKNDATTENLEDLVGGKTPNIRNKVMSEKYPSHNDNLYSDAITENLKNLVGGSNIRNKISSETSPSHNGYLNATTEDLDRGETPNVSYKVMSEKYRSHNDNLDCDTTSEDLVKGNTHNISNKVVPEKYLSNNKNLDSDATTENLVREKTPNISLVLGKSSIITLPKDNLLNHSDIHAHLVVDMPNKHTTLPVEVSKENIEHVKLEDKLINLSESKNNIEEIRKTNGNYSKCDASKISNWLKENMEKGTESSEEQCSCDDSDFESAVRGLEEAMTLSESDGISIQINPRTINLNTDNVLLNKDSVKLNQNLLSSDINENIEPNKYAESSKEIVCTRADCQTNTDIGAHIPYQNKQFRRTNLKSHEFPTGQHFEKELLKDNNDRSSMSLQLSTAFYEPEKINYEKVNSLKNKVNAEFTSSLSSEKSNPVSISKMCLEETLFEGKTISTEEMKKNIFSQREKEDHSEDELTEMVQKDILEKHSSYSLCKPYFNEAYQLEVLEGEGQCAKFNKGTNFASSPEKSKNSHTCIPEETMNPLEKISLCTGKVGEKHVLDSHSETVLTQIEKNVIGHWWTKYKSIFTKEISYHSSYCLESFLDYTYETWPDINIDSNNKGDEQVHIDFLKSELKHLELKKYIMLKENNMEVELEDMMEDLDDELEDISSEGISDDEISPEAPEMQAQRNCDLSEFVSSSKHANIIITHLAGTTTQDHMLPIQPPLPLYPPPRTPSPPPVPSSSLEVLPPASPARSVSPSSSVLCNELPRGNFSNSISNIPLPPSDLQSTKLINQQPIPNLDSQNRYTHGYNTERMDTKKSLDPLSSNLLSFNLSNRSNSNSFHDLNSAPTLLLEHKFVDSLSQQRKSNLTLKTTEQAVDNNLDHPDMGITEMLPLHETHIPNHAISDSNLSSKPEQLQPLKSVSPLKSAQTPLLPDETSESNLSINRQTIQDLAKQSEILVESHFSSGNNVIIEGEPALTFIKPYGVLCKNLLIEKNLCIIKCWKSKVNKISIKTSLKRSRMNRPFLFNVRKNITKLSRRKGLFLKMKKPVLSSMKKFEVHKKENFNDQPSHKTKHLGNNYYLPLDKISVNKIKQTLNSKQKFCFGTENKLSNNAIDNDNYDSILSETEIKVEKEYISAECPITNKISDICLQNDDNMSKEISTEEDICLQNVDNLSKEVSTEEDMEVGNIPTIVSVISIGEKSSQSLEIPELRELDNEDNKFWKYVDKPKPSNLLDCKLDKDEKNINISSELIGHSTTIDLKDISTNMSEIPCSGNSSPMKLDYTLSENYLLNDLEISSSDDDSESECYMRPRIINGFGDPFILPCAQEMKNPSILTMNVKSLNNIKIEGSHTVIQDLKQSPATFSDEFTLTKAIDEGAVLSKSPNHKSSESNKSHFTVVPRFLEKQSTKNKTYSKSENVPKETTNNSIYKNSEQLDRKKNQLEKEKLPLKQKNQVVSVNNILAKRSEESSTYKGKSNTSKSKYLNKNIRSGIHKQKPKRYLTKERTTENITGSLNVTESATTITYPIEIETRHNTSNNSIQNNSLQNSHVLLSNLDSSVSKKNKVDIRSSQRTIQNKSLPDKPIQKENASYQPSNIRKRLTSEVENIIPIKREPSKTSKTQLPVKNVATTLKRSQSLSETTPFKIVNPVFDTIVKDMDASPPPKSLIIKEPESQKYIAEAYWCNQIQTSTNQNHAENKDANELSETHKDLNKQHKSTAYHCQAVNKTLAERNLESNRILGRSISLNSEVLNKKEKNRNDSFKLNELISISNKGQSKTKNMGKRSPEDLKKKSPDKIHKRKNDEKEKPSKPPKETYNLEGVAKTKRIKESLPSMPLIEFESNLESSVEKQCDSESKTFVANRVSLPAVETSKKDLIRGKSCSDTIKLSLKVSIPISHYTSLFGRNSKDIIQPKKSNTIENAHDNNSKNHKKVSSSMQSQLSIADKKTKRKDLKNKLTGKNLHLRRDSPLNKALGKHDKVKKQHISSKNSQHSKSSSINNSSSAICPENSLIVTGQKLQGKSSGDKTVNSAGGLKRPLTESKSESKAKQKKSSLKSFDNCENPKSDLIQVTSNSQLSCPDQERDLISTTADSSVKSFAGHELSSVSCSKSNEKASSSEQNNQLKNNMLFSLPVDETNLKVLRDLALSNDLEISIPKNKCSDLNMNGSETTSFSDGVISNTECLTLRVKHPSLLQTSNSGDLGPQQLQGRRISVISPEALSSGVQLNDKDNFKRHTWYMEPENDPRLSDGKTKSLFSSLLDEPKKKTELIKTFRMSLKIGKKEHEQMHDVIRCIEFDYKQKQDFIETVRKLKSSDVVKQEIKRATTEYENKLVERESFFRKTFSNLLDHFKDASDYVYLAFYVFFSQKIVYLCSEAALKDSLLKLLKIWIQKDHRKQVFDQDDSAFVNDCEIVLKILSEIENWTLLLSGVDTPPIHQSSRSTRKIDLEDFSLEKNTTQGSANTSITTNQNAVEPNESGFSSCSSLVKDLREPQALAQSCLVEENTPSQLVEHILNECSTNAEPRSFLTPPFGECSMPSDINDNDLNDCEAISSDITDKLTNKTCAISSQEIVNQEILAQPGIPKSIPQHALNTGLQSQTLTQPASHNSNISFNQDTTYQRRTQESTNMNNITCNISQRQNNFIPQMASRNNTNPNYQNIGHQLNEKQKNPVLNSLVPQTKNTFDKYQNMRQGNQTSSMTNHPTSVLYGECNEISLLGPNLANQAFVFNESSSPSSSCTQGIREPYVCSVQFETSQPVTTASVYPIGHNSQSPQSRGMQHHSSNVCNQNNEIEKLAYMCQTQSSYKDNPHFNHRSDQTLQPMSNYHEVQPMSNYQGVQPMSNYHAVQPPQRQVSHYLRGNGTIQQLSQENSHISQRKTVTNIHTNKTVNPQTVQYFPNNNTTSSQPYTQTLNLPINHQQLRSTSINQEEQNQGTSWQQKCHPLQENQIHAHILNHSSNTSNTSVMCMQNVSVQHVPVQHVPHRRYSNDGKSRHLIKQTHNQSLQNFESFKPQQQYQQNFSSRRYSVESQPPQQSSNNSSLNQQSNTLGYSEKIINQNISNPSQRENEFYNIPLDPKTVQTSSDPAQSRGVFAVLSEQSDLNSITEADLFNLFNSVDGEKIVALMENIDNNDNISNHPNVIRTTNQNSQTSSKSHHHFDGTKQTALINIDNNLQFIDKLPDDSDLTFNGVNITKHQLCKFINICREQVSFVGLKEDRETTFIGQFRSADGRSFSQDETICLMKGVIAMNACQITKIKIEKEHETKKTKQVLIQTLKATAFKDVASYLRIIDILKKLAIKDKDARQAVQEIVAILRVFRQPEQVVSSTPVIVIDD